MPGALPSFISHDGRRVAQRPLTCRASRLELPFHFERHCLACYPSSSILRGEVDGRPDGRLRVQKVMEYDAVELRNGLEPDLHRSREGAFDRPPEAFVGAIVGDVDAEVRPPSAPTPRMPQRLRHGGTRRSDERLIGYLDTAHEMSFTHRDFSARTRRSNRPRNRVYSETNPTTRE